MDIKEIILISALFLVVGFRLYSKYGKKKTSGDGTVSNKGKENAFHQDKDDYEPYSSGK